MTESEFQHALRVLRKHHADFFRDFVDALKPDFEKRLYAQPRQKTEGLLARKRMHRETEQEALRLAERKVAELYLLHNRMFLALKREYRARIRNSN
jgi:hypothetical protein